MSKSEQNRKAFTFRLDITPPTSTGQMKKYTRTKSGKTVVYEDERAKQARQIIRHSLQEFAPGKPFKGPIQLDVVWNFPVARKYRSGEWKMTKPDTDNLSKILKDEMSRLGFWKDDKEVTKESIQKIYSANPGIDIRIRQLEKKKQNRPAFTLIHKETGKEVTTKNVKEFLYHLEKWFGHEVEDWFFTHPEEGKGEPVYDDEDIQEIVLSQDGTVALNVLRYYEHGYDTELIYLREEDYEIVWD